MYCKKCKTDKEKYYFYNGIIGICKDCLQNEFERYKQKDDAYDKIPFLIICRKYNLYYDDNLVESLHEKKFILKEYLKIIKTLPQYKGLYFKDSFNKINENSLSEYFGDVKDDIDFIEKDIIIIKNHIINSLDTGDINAHNKWMNNLRDALELKNKLNEKNNLDTLKNGIIYKDNKYDVVSISTSLKDNKITIEYEDKFINGLRRDVCTYYFTDCSAIDCLKKIFKDLKIIYDEYNLDCLLENNSMIFTKKYENISVYDIIYDLFDKLNGITNKYYKMKYDYNNNMVKIKETDIKNN